MNQNVLVMPSLLVSYANKTKTLLPKVDQVMDEALRIMGQPSLHAIRDMVNP